MTQYDWRDGARVNGVKAQVAGEALERIAKSHGDKLVPKDVVEESRPDNAPLHPAFEWDDATAAGYYRVGQARQIIRAVIITPDVKPEVIDLRPRDPAWVHVPSMTRDEPGYYRTPEVLVKHQDEWDRARVQLRSYLISAAHAFGDLMKLSGNADEARRLKRAMDQLMAIKVDVEDLRKAS